MGLTGFNGPCKGYSFLVQPIPTPQQALPFVYSLVAQTDRSINI